MLRHCCIRFSKWIGIWIHYEFESGFDYRMCPWHLTARVTRTCTFTQQLSGTDAAGFSTGSDQTVRCFDGDADTALYTTGAGRTQLPARQEHHSPRHQGYGTHLESRAYISNRDARQHLRSGRLSVGYCFVLHCVWQRVQWYAYANNQVCKWAVLNFTGK